MALPKVQFSKAGSSVPLFALLVGPTGAGKSSSIGSLAVPTLYLHTRSESQGPRAAAALNKSIAPLCIDGDDKQTPDEHFANVIDWLSDVEGIKKQGFKAVALDGYSELEALLLTSTAIKTYCRTKDGGHNNFKEPEFVQLKLRELRKVLQSLHDAGLHVIATCGATLTSPPDDLSSYAVAPRLKSWGTMDTVMSQFPDILVCARAVKKGGGSEFCFLYHATISRSQEKDDGSLKVASFTPRLTDTLITSYPERSSSNLAKVLAFRDELVKKGEGIV